MLRPRAEIPRHLDALARDIAKEADREYDRVYAEALRRGLVELVRDLDEADTLDAEEYLDATLTTNGDRLRREA